LQKLSGSIEQSEESRLTPFEKAEYNLVKFAIGLDNSYQLQELLKKLEFLEGIRSIAKGFDDSSLEVKGNSNLNREITSIEIALSALCAMYGDSAEA